MAPEEILSIALRLRLNKRLWAISLSVATIEGWFDKPRPDGRPIIPQFCLNPGNLRPADSDKGMIPPSRFERAQKEGVFKRTPKDPGYVQFASIGSGWAALVNDLTAKALRNMSFRDAIEMYAPAKDGNNPDKYVGFVMESLLVDAPSMTASIPIVRWTGTLPKIRLPFPDEICPKPGTNRPDIKGFMKMIEK